MIMHLYHFYVVPSVERAVAVSRVLPGDGLWAGYESYEVSGEEG